MQEEREGAIPSIRERIALHLHATLSRNGGRADRQLLTQTGIADALNITRAHAAIELQRGMEKGMFTFEKAKMGGSKRELKIYTLTLGGMQLAERLVRERESARVVEESIASPSKHSPERVLKELGERDLALLSSLRIAGKLELRYIRGLTKVPFAIRNGDTVQLSDIAALAVDRLLADGERRRLACSFLADYSLNARDYASRFKYLVESGRMSEAAKLVDYHTDELRNSNPARIADSLLALEGWSESPGDSLLLLAARTLMQLARYGEALERLARISERTDEVMILSKLAELEMDGEPLGADTLAALGGSIRTDRERSVYHRLLALSCFRSGETEKAEREMARATRYAMQSGDESELRMNYSLHGRMARSRGDYPEAARVESKLRSLEEVHSSHSD